MAIELTAAPAMEPRFRILVVDDDPGSRWALSGALRDVGYDVAQAADGLEALEACREVEPDLVVTDLEMPRMRGEALIAALRRDHPTVEIAVVTGNDQPDAGRYAVALGVPHWFSKPVQLEELITRLGAALHARLS